MHWTFFSSHLIWPLSRIWHCFSLLFLPSFWCCSAVHWIWNLVVVVSIQPLDAGISIFGVAYLSLSLFFFCHRRIRRVLNIRSFWIIYLSYTFLCIHRKNLGDNYCGLSLRVTDFCVSVQGRKDRRREKNIPCGLSITDSYSYLYVSPDFLFHP